MDGSRLRHERVVSRDGVGLHVVRAGAGPLVVLLHGFPEHWISWRHQIDALVAAGFSVAAPDLRGYNRSDRPAARDAYHLRFLVDDVAAVIAASGHSRAHVVGHDWGGVIAWVFAGERPAMLDRLVIMNAPHTRLYIDTLRKNRRQLRRSWYVLFFRLPWLPERALAAGNYAAVRRLFTTQPARRGAFSTSDVEQYVTSLRQPGALTAALNFYRANAARSAIRLARLARTDAETLVIWGEKDPALVPEVLDGLGRVASRARVHRLADVSHWVQNEAPDEVNRVLIEFLSAAADAADNSATVRAPRPGP
jgi:pimeloyl-ACP methyl ester carboxylesterase